MFELLIAAGLAILTLVTGHDWPLAMLVGGLILLPGLLVIRSGAPFVPSSRETVQRMLKLANIKPSECVVDLGCGDGRLVIAAAKLGAQAIGYERSLPTFLLAWIKALPHRRARIRFRNFWKQDHRNADVVFCYLLTSTMQEFRDCIWPTLKPGCRVISHAFRMAGVEPRAHDGNVVLYIRPNV